MGVIIGAAVGGALVLILILLGLFLFLRRRKAHKRVSLPPMTPALPIQSGAGLVEAGLGRGAGRSSAYANNEKLAPFVRPTPVPTFAAPEAKPGAQPIKDFSSHYEILNKSLSDLPAASHARSTSQESASSRNTESSGAGLLHKTSLSKLKRSATSQVCNLGLVGDSLADAETDRRSHHLSRGWDLLQFAQKAWQKEPMAVLI
jgi:hypothetical protein